MSGAAGTGSGRNSSPAGSKGRKISFTPLGKQADANFPWGIRADAAGLEGGGADAASPEGEGAQAAGSFQAARPGSTFLAGRPCRDAIVVTSIGI